MAGELLVEFGIGVTALAVAGALAARVGLSVIPAYIVVGILVGPHEPTSFLGVPLTLVEDGEFIELLSEVGIVLLLFFLGLEFSLETLLASRERLFRVGAIDLVVNFAIGLGLGFAFGFSPLESLFVAGIVYVSSSAVITKSLIEQGWIVDPESEPILGTLVFEDVFVAIYLALLSAVALGEGGIVDAAVGVGVAFLFLGVLTAVAWYGTGYVERLFVAGPDELFLLRVLGVTVLVAGAALAAGVSEAVAAFFVGTAFSGTSHVERIEHVVAPARDLFGAVFFLAIGLRTDVTLIAGVAGLLVVAVAVTTLGKLLSGTLSGRLYGLGRARSVRVGLGMVPRGEFSLVIAALASSAGVGALADAIPAFAVGYVLVMSILGTVLIQQSDRITALVDRAGGET